MNAPLVLYTIGHSNLTADEFLALLRRHQIGVLVDVRSAPYSRYVPHFNKGELQAFLLENGIDYRYAGEYLGGRPQAANLYKDQQLPSDDTERANYLKQVDYAAVMKQDWYQRGIRRLLDIVTEASANVTILCSEANPHDCHRHHLIARSLLDPAVRVTEQNVKVHHIMRDGAVEVVEASGFEETTLRQQRLL